MVSTPAADLSSFVGVTRHRCFETPEVAPFSFLSGAEQNQIMTYRQLDRSARSLGAWLQKRGFEGDRVLVMYPSGPAFIKAIFGCFYAGAVPVPVYPPHLALVSRTFPRLLAIIKDATPRIAFAPPEFTTALARLGGGSEQIQSSIWTQLPDDSDNLADEWRSTHIMPSDIALLQYTSGSTAAPKGVMVTHANLLDNAKRIQDAFGIRQQVRGVSWLPPFHDMGLIGGVFQPVYSGFSVHLMSPLTFLQRPLRWLQAISILGASISGGPNFAYELCVQKISDENKKSLDLSCWKVAFNGSEPVQSRSLERFAEAFRECGFRSDSFRPCYGLAEATLMVSAARESSPVRLLSLDRGSLEANRVVCADETHSRDLCTVVSCGRADEDVVIVSPESLTACPDGKIGEIWFAGGSVAKGYWNRPAETQHTFDAYRADNGDGPFLRTGDLGFKWRGELFVTGRLKDLIIIAGRNHYPHDIEMTVEQSHASIRPGCCVAFSIAVDGEERLIVAAELHRKPPDETERREITRTILRDVSEVHGLQVHSVALLKSGRIPKTSSGKTQRLECRRAFTRGELTMVGD